jgi:hypothetical protein
MSGRPRLVGFIRREHEDIGGDIHGDTVDELIGAVVARCAEIGETMPSPSGLAGSLSDADVWARFMAAALMAAPHAPADKLATTADEALVEYRRRCASGGSLAPGASAAEAVATRQPFGGHVDGDAVHYDIPPTTPKTDKADSPFSPP